VTKVTGQKLQFILDNISYHADVILDINQLLQEYGNADRKIDNELKRINLSTLELKATLEKINPTIIDWEDFCHAIRTPITTIKGHGELLIEDLIERFAALPTTYSFLHDILASATYILETVETVDHHTDKLEVCPSRVPSQLMKSRIVISDNNPISQKILSRRLSRDGYDVTLTQDIASTIKSINLAAVEMVLICIDRLNFTEQTKISRIRRENPNLVILVISHSSNIQLIIECMESGVDDFLHAPINAVLLRVKIQRALENQMLRQQQKRYWQVLNQAVQSIEHGFALFDEKWQLQLANKGFYQIYGKNTNSEYLIDFEKIISEKNSNIHELRVAEQQSIVTQLPNDKRWIEIAYSNMPEGGIVTIHKDITERKERQEKWKNMALTDPLTGLANRILLKNIVEDKLQANEKFALLYCDLDAFKAANDYWGHEFGDFILKQLALRMNKVFRDTDTVARIGGDEFVIVCKESDSKLASLKGYQLMEAVRKPFIKGEKVASINISIGISLFPLHGSSYEYLLDIADKAMFQAKRNGKDQLNFHT